MTTRSSHDGLKGQRKTLNITPALHKKMTLLRVVKHIGRIGITLQYTRAQGR